MPCLYESRKCCAVLTKLQILTSTVRTLLEVRTFCLLFGGLRSKILISQRQQYKSGCVCVSDAQPFFPVMEKIICVECVCTAYTSHLLCMCLCLWTWASSAHYGDVISAITLLNIVMSTYVTKPQEKTNNWIHDTRLWESMCILFHFTGCMSKAFPAAVVHLLVVLKRKLSTWEEVVGGRWCCLLGYKTVSVVGCNFLREVI